MSYTAKDLFAAFRQADEKQISDIIASDPTLLFSVDKNQNNVAHLAIKTKQLDILKLVLTQLKARFPNDWFFVLSQTNRLHYTPLTSAALSGAELYDCFIQEAGDAAPYLARQGQLQEISDDPNDEEAEVSLDSYLPIDYLRNEDEDYDIHISNSLLALMANNSYKPFNQAISFDEVVKKIHPHFLNPALLQNLNFACVAANYVRRLITVSCTHPSSNEMDYTRFLNAEVALKQQEIKIKNVIPKDHTDENLMKFIRDCHQILKTNAEGEVVANCQEICYAVIAALLDLGIKTSVSILEIENADHVLVKLGDGPDAVFIDAFLGENLPVADQALVYYTLKACASFDSDATDDAPQKKYNVLLDLDPNYHKIISSKDGIRFSSQVVAERNEAHHENLDNMAIAELENNQAFIQSMRLTSPTQAGAHGLYSHSTTSSTSAQGQENASAPASKR